MQRAFGRFVAIASWERSISLVVWVLIVLHLTGLLGDVIDWMEATRLPLGKTPVSLWGLLSATMSVVVTLLVTLWLGSSLESRLMRTQSLDMNLRVVLARVGRAFMVLLALLLGLSFAGLDLTVLSVFGGALGVGLGLGLQKIASNYVSGFIILLDRSLRIGDLISVDKFYGAVARINTRYTVVEAFDGTEAIVPNEMLVSLPVTNHSLNNRRVRLAFKVFLRYGADLDQALRLADGGCRRPASRAQGSATDRIFAGLHGRRHGIGSGILDRRRRSRACEHPVGDRRRHPSAVQGCGSRRPVFAAPDFKTRLEPSYPGNALISRKSGAHPAN